MRFPGQSFLSRSSYQLHLPVTQLPSCPPLEVVVVVKVKKSAAAPNTGAGATVLAAGSKSTFTTWSTGCFEYSRYLIQITFE